MHNSLDDTTVCLQSYTLWVLICSFLFLVVVGSVGDIGYFFFFPASSTSASRCHR